MSVIELTLKRVRLAPPAHRLNLTIHPLLLAEENGDKPNGRYIPLADAIQAGTARVTEMSDAGTVPQLAVQDEERDAAVVADGEQLVGAKQNRVVNLSILVPHTSLLPIPVSCVERGRWSYRTRELSTTPYAMFGAGRAGKAASVTRAMKERGSRAADQGAVWDDVHRYAAALRVDSGTEALHDVYERNRASLDEYLADLPAEPEQVGAVFSIGDRAVGVELFESPFLWDRYAQHIVGSYALDAMVDRRPRRAGAQPDSPAALLDELRSSRISIFPAVGLGEDLRIEGDGLTGGALLLDGQVVHLAAFRRAAAGV